MKKTLKRLMGDTSLISYLLSGCVFDLLVVVTSQSNSGQLYRLAEVHPKNWGRLELTVGNSWGVVCASGYDERDARVVCRSLGLPTDDSRPLKEDYRSEFGSMVLKSFNCIGNETSLMECYQEPLNGETTCPERQVVRVLCETAYENKFRLMDGRSLTAGRVEFYHRRHWGTAQVSNSADTEAQVLCRSLGFPYKMSRFIDSLAGITERKGMWLRDVQCNGTEDSWTQCSLSIYAAIEYRFRQDVFVSCEDLRLRPKTGEEGVLQGYSEGEWRKVYSSQFSSKEAEVACRVLNLPRSGARVLDISTANRHEYKMALNVYGCRGEERRLTSCGNARWQRMHAGEVHISCERTDVSDVKFRLADGHSRSVGRLDVYHRGQWGTVCGVGIRGPVVAVACRTLGLPDQQAYATPPDFIADGDREVILYGLECKGNESSLKDCYFNSWRTGQCSNHLAIHCGPAGREMDVRLVGGRDPESGRVEIFLHGGWIRLCRLDGYSDAVAVVMCRQLGKPTYSAKTTQCFDSGTGHSWNYGVICTGTEKNISECRTFPTSPEYCEDLRIICSYEYVDDSGCFSTKPWVYIIAGVCSIIFIVLIAITTRKYCKENRRKRQRREETLQVTFNNISGDSVVIRRTRTEEISALSNPASDTASSSVYDPPPSYDSLF